MGFSNPLGAPPAATVIVAASDSQSRAIARYVCDGVDDHLDIQAALDDLPAVGGEVLLLEGTYNLSGTVTLPADGRLSGVGAGTILDKDNAGPAVVLGGARAHLRSVAFAAGKADSAVGVELSGAPEAVVDDIVDRSGSDWAVRVLAASHRATVRNVQALAIDGGIYLEASDDVTVAGCVIDAAFDQAVLVDDTAPRTVIAECLVLGSGSGDAGIEVQAPDCVLIANRVHNAGDRGIYAWNLADQILILGNVVRDSVGNGISTSGDDSRVVGNLIERAGGRGLLITILSRFTVQGNIVVEAQEHGIQVNAASDGALVGNAVYTCGQAADATWNGIHVGGAASDRNNLQANTVRHGGGAVQHAHGIRIDAATCEDNLVTNNDLLNSGRTASLSDLGTGTVTVAGNRL